MIKKINIIFFVFAVFLSLSILNSSYGGGNEQKSSFNIVKIDNKNERLFVIASENTINNIKTTKEIISQGAEFIKNNKAGWSSKWNISFFSEKKYAAYKYDESVIELVVDGSWEKNYLAEYDNRKKTLILFPLQPNKRYEKKIKLP